MLRFSKLFFVLSISACGVINAAENEIERVNDAEVKFKKALAVQTFTATCVSRRTLQCIEQEVMSVSEDIFCTSQSFMGDCAAQAVQDCKQAGCSNPDTLNNCNDYINKINIDSQPAD